MPRASSSLMAASMTASRSALPERVASIRSCQPAAVSAAICALAARIISPMWFDGLLFRSGQFLSGLLCVLPGLLVVFSFGRTFVRRVQRGNLLLYVELCLEGVHQGLL